MEVSGSRGPPVYSGEFVQTGYNLPWAGVAYAHPAFVFEISFECYEHLLVNSVQHPG